MSNNFGITNLIFDLRIIVNVHNLRTVPKLFNLMDVFFLYTLFCFFVRVFFLFCLRHIKKVYPILVDASRSLWSTKNDLNVTGSTTVAAVTMAGRISTSPKHKRRLRTSQPSRKTIRSHRLDKKPRYTNDSTRGLECCGSLWWVTRTNCLGKQRLVE